MRLGSLHVDLRDKSIVKILDIILPAKSTDTPICEVVDIMTRCRYQVDGKFLSAEVEPDSVLDWIKAP